MKLIIRLLKVAILLQALSIAYNVWVGEWWTAIAWMNAAALSIMFIHRERQVIDAHELRNIVCDAIEKAEREL